MGAIQQLNPIGFYYGDSTFYVGGVSYATRFADSNPKYSVTNDFLTYCPEFENIICGQTTYTRLVERLVNQANHIFDFKLYGSDWHLAMSLYVAHWFYKTLQRVASIVDIPSQASTGEVISALTSQSVGIITEENLGGEAIKTENLLNVKGLENAGDYATTPYGIQMWTLISPYLKLSFIGRYGY